MELPLLLGLGAGSVSAVNPCGFAMPPAFVGFFLGEREEAGAGLARRLLRAAAVAGLVTAGFVVVFVPIGAAVSLGSRSLVRYVPWLGLGVGVVLIGVGIAFLVGRTVALDLHPVQRVGGRRNRSMVVYGVGYGLASVGCTLPVFLAVVGGAVAAGGILPGVAVFVAYALGMGLVVLAVSVATALGKDAVARWLRRLMPHLGRVGGLGLMAAGAYLVFLEVRFLRFAGIL